MARELTPEELRELLAAYALDAVDGDERAQLDAYLQRCEDARRELDELRETAALLVQVSPEQAPDALWERIDDELGAEPPRLVVPFESSAARATERGSRGLVAKVAVGIAVASAVAASLTVVLVKDEMSRQDEQLDEMAASVAREGVQSAAAAAAADPHATTLRLDSPTSTASATVVTMPDGTGFLMGHDVPRLDAGRQVGHRRGAPQPRAGHRPGEPTAAYQPRRIGWGRGAGFRLG